MHHLRQGLADGTAGNHGDERALGELNAEDAVEGAVEDRVAGAAFKVGEDDLDGWTGDVILPALPTEPGGYADQNDGGSDEGHG